MKKFIKIVKTQPWLRRGRQFLAATLIFSMLAMDVAKAMEDDTDEKAVQSVPLILKTPSKDGIIINSEDQQPLNTFTIPIPYTDEAETHIIHFANQSLDSDKYRSKDTSFESTGSFPEKPQSKSSAIIPYIVLPILSSTSQDIPPASFSSPPLPTNLGSPVDSLSIQDREQPLFSISVNYPQLSSSLIIHPLEEVSGLDEAHFLLEKKHRQSKKSVSIRKSSNIVRLQKQEPKPLPNPELLTSSRDNFSSHVSYSQKAKLVSQKAEKKQKILKELIGDETVEDSLSSENQKKLRKPPLFPSEALSHEKTSLLRNQSMNEGYSSIQTGDFVRVSFRDEEDGDNPEFIEFTILDDTSRASRPLPSSIDQKYRSCCGRPILPQRTKYTLLDLGNQLHQPSQSLSFRQRHSPHEEEDHDLLSSSDSIDSEGSSPLNGSPTKIIQVQNVVLEDDSEDEDFSSEDLFVSPLVNGDIPQDDNRSGNFLADTVSRPPLILIDGQDLEVGISAAQIPSFWESFTDNDHAQLKRYKHQELDGKSTWPQRLGKWIIGPIIGGAYGYAMAPVYMGGFLYLNSAIIDELLAGVFGNTFVYYIMASSASDGTPRNAHFWKRAINSFTTESQEKARVFLTTLGCILPSCVEPVYLITAELSVMQSLDLHGLDNLAAAYMIVLCPFLFADSFASNFVTAWKGWDEDIKENIEKLRSYLSQIIFREAIDTQPKSQVRIDRDCLEQKLHKLNKFLFNAPPAQIDEIYEAISQIKVGNMQIPPDLNEEDLPLYQAYGALSYFFSLGDQIKEGQKQIKSLYETLSDVFTYSSLALGSPARLLVLEFIGETIFGLFCPKIATKVLGWIFAIIGFPFQTGLEYKGMQNFFRDFMWQEEPDGHTSHPGVRRTAKTYIMLQALIYILPLAVMSLQTCNIWFSSDWWMMGFIPFIVPEFATQATNFNGTYNREIVTAVTNVHNKVTRKKLGYSLRTDWKKDQLIQLIQASQGDLKNMSPELIHFFVSQFQE